MAKFQWFVAVSAVLLVAGNVAVEANLKPAPGLLDLVIAAPQYSTLVTALKITNLVPVLAEVLKTSPITVFAPDNAAFARIPPKIFKFLTTTDEGKKILAEILAFHVVKGKFPAPHPGSKLLNLAGSYLYITKYYYALFVNKVKVTGPAIINGPQGVVHGIKDVLIPPKYRYLFEKPKPKKHYWYWPWY